MVAPVCSADTFWQESSRTFVVAAYTKVLRTLTAWAYWKPNGAAETEVYYVCGDWQDLWHLKTVFRWRCPRQIPKLRL